MGDEQAEAAKGSAEASTRTEGEEERDATRNFDGPRIEDDECTPANRMSVRIADNDSDEEEEKKSMTKEAEDAAEGEVERERNNPETSESHREMEAEPQGSPEELLEIGRALMKEKKLEEAIEALGAALKKKLREFADDHSHPGLSKFYLVYGDALLQQEEANCDIFNLGGKSGREVDSAAPPLTEEISDEQVAWETLELARISFSRRLESLEREGRLHRSTYESALLEGGPSQTSSSSSSSSFSSSETQDGNWSSSDLCRVMRAYLGMVKERGEKESEMSSQFVKDSDAMSGLQDFIFVRLRLSDILLMQERLTDAQEELTEAARCVVRYAMPYTELSCLAVPLAQCLLYDKKKVEALEIYKVAYDLVCAHRRGVAGATVASHREEDMRSAEEDLKLEIDQLDAEIQRQERGEADELEEVVQNLMQPPPEEKDSFDAPSSAALPVIDLGVVSSKRKTPDTGAEGSSEGKKRRIDLSALQVAKEGEVAKEGASNEQTDVDEREGQEALNATEDAKHHVVSKEDCVKGQRVPEGNEENFLVSENQGN